MRFAASAAKVIKTIRHNWHYIQEDPTVGNHFPHYPIMAFKKNTNLKRFLVCACIKPDVVSETNSIELELEHHPVTNFPKIDQMNPPKNIITPCPIKRHFLLKYLSTSRAVPIIGSAKISASNMTFFTNIGIGTEQ